MENRKLIEKLLGVKPNASDLQARVDKLEAALSATLEYQGLTVCEVSAGVFEVIKDRKPSTGDYLNPIEYKRGMPVVKGLFYTDNTDIWEAIKTGVPNGFNDRLYFDIIE